MLDKFFSFLLPILIVIDIGGSFIHFPFSVSLVYLFFLLIALSLYFLKFILFSETIIFISAYKIYFVLLYVILFLIFGVSILWSKAPIYGFYKFVSFFGLIFTYSFFGFFLKSISWKYFLRSVIMISIILIAFILQNYGTPLHLYTNFGLHDRIGNEENAPIAIARVLGFLVFSISISIANQKNLIYLFIYILLLTLLISFLIFTGSKGPIVSLLFLMVLANFNKLFRLFAIGTVCFAIFYIIFPALIEEISNNSFIFDRYLNDRSVTGRSDLFKIVFDKFYYFGIFSVLFGNGIGSFGFFEHGSDLSGYPHNLFLEVLFENGIIVVLPFVLLLLYLIYKFGKEVLYQLKISLGISLYFFINAMFTGDISYNFFIFIFYLIFLQQKSLINGKIQIT